MKIKMFTLKLSNMLVCGLGFNCTTLAGHKQSNCNIQ